MRRLLGVVLLLTLFAAFPLLCRAQLSFDADDVKAAYVLTARDTVTLSADRDISTIAVMSNCEYTVTASDDWFTCELSGAGSITVVTTLNNTDSSRSGVITVESSDGTYSRVIVVVQESGSSSEALSAFADIQLTVSGGSASAESGNPFSYSYDGSISTYFHSPWSSGSTSFPFTMIWKLEEASHVDYMTYTPRQDNQSGAWGTITVSYYVGSSWTTLGTYALGQSWSSATINFGDDGVDDVTQVRVVVADGYASVVTAAEVQFFQKNTAADEFMAYFKDDLCTELIDGFTESDLTTMSNAYMRSYAAQVYEGTYSTDYRVFEAEPYETTSTLQSRLKNSNPYCPVENPIGIYFDEGESVAIVMADIPDDSSVSLIVKSYTSASTSSGSTSYSLRNGINVITTSSAGNGYISYYDDDYASLPNVRGHVIMGQQNGVFNSETDDNAKWKELLSNAVSLWLDIVTPRLQVAAPVDQLKSGSPSDGLSVCHIYDQVVYREREIMGLLDDEPKNHQFAQPTTSGSIYASTEGAYMSYTAFSTWAQADSSDFDVWGLAHELGHNNQVTGFKWVGCGETTNNVYAAWAQHRLGGGYHRLEDESCSINGGSSVRGGRFNCYLENGVRKGEVWQRQEGADYYGYSDDEYTVTNENGKTVTTTSRNYDHFVKLAPLWQLELFCLECGFAPDAWADWFEYLRNNSAASTAGKQQIKFITQFSILAGYDFLDFFEKAGMFKEQEIYVTDYSMGWINITADMIEEAEETIAEAGLKEAPAALNYINAYNWEVFRDEAALDASNSVGSGCSKYSSSQIRVTNARWPNAVGYNTYDSDGNLLHISMFGLGDSQQSTTYTYVMWDSSSSYITAVGYDGTEAIIYQP